jgi:O-antigen ligase
LMSFALVQQPGQLQGLLRIAYAMVVLPMMFVLWRPSLRRIAFLMASYVAGTAVSVIDGLITGPGGDGRTMGLTPHPNALGHTALVSLALVPFLSAVHPSSRWLIRLAAAVCLYGIWLSGSRGSLIALVLVVLVYILVESSATVALFAWGVGIVLFLVAPRLLDGTGNNALTRILGGGSAEDATSQRAVALHQALDQISAHPFIGNGFDTIRAAQSAYLQITAALGIIGLIALVLILLGFAVPLVTAPHPIRLLSYTATAYLLLAPFTDSLSDTMIWAPLSLCILVRPKRAVYEAGHVAPYDRARARSPFVPPEPS